MSIIQNWNRIWMDGEIFRNISCLSQNFESLRIRYICWIQVFYKENLKLHLLDYFLENIRTLESIKNKVMGSMWHLINVLSIPKNYIQM